MNKKLFLILVIIFSSLSCSGSNSPTISIMINEKTYKFEVAATREARMRGLMYRKKLNKDSGMFFIYKYEEYMSFYMKNTYVPLSIAFINKSFEIINIENGEPLDETNIDSIKPAMYVLEVNRGFFERVGIKVGDKLDIVSAIPYIE